MDRDQDRVHRRIPGLPNVTETKEGLKWRRAIPEDLRPFFGGKKEVSRRLPADLEQAKVRTKELNEWHDQKIEEARRKLGEFNRHPLPAVPNEVPAALIWKLGPARLRIPVTSEMTEIEAVIFQELENSEVMTSGRPHDTTLTLPEALKLVETWAAQVVPTGNSSPIAEMLRSAGVKAVLPGGGTLEPALPSELEPEAIHDDYWLAEEYEVSQPILAKTIREAAVVRIDMTGCGSADDRLKRVLAAVQENPALSHPRIDREVYSLARLTGIHPTLEPGSEDFRILRYAIAKAWFKLLIS